MMFVCRVRWHSRCFAVDVAVVVGCEGLVVLWVVMRKKGSLLM